MVWNPDYSETYGKLTLRKIANSTLTMYPPNYDAVLFLDRILLQYALSIFTNFDILVF